MSGGFLMPMMAASFIVGCILIHALRAHAKAMTPVLGIVAACLGVFVALTGLADERPVVSAGRAATAPRGQGHATAKPPPPQR